MLHVYSKYAQEYEKAINKELFQKKAKNQIKQFISTPFDFTGKILRVYHLTGKGFRDMSDLEKDVKWAGLADFTYRAADAYLGIMDINRKMKEN
jgi:hypothetical protein